MSAMNDTKKYFIGLDSIIEQAKKSRHNCMCPNCQSIAIGSHVFSRSHILEPISRQSKICQFEQRPLVHMDDGIVRYWPKGIKGAFKFNGFCQKHDNEIFAPIEPNDDSLIDWSELKSQYLLCYRTICREIYANQIMHDIFEHLILHSGANIPYYKEQLMFKLTRTNANKSSLMYYKTFLENGIFHSDFSNLHFYFAELPFQLDLCIASPVSIQSDKGPDFNRDYQDLYIINIFPYKGRTVIIIGYSNCFENSWLKNIISKFESSYPHRVSSAFVDVLYRAEFHAMSPALFDSLDKELLDAFYQTWIKESGNFSEEIEEVSNLFYAQLNKIMPSTWKTL